MSNEDSQASSAEPNPQPAPTDQNTEGLSAGHYDHNPPTGAFPAYQPPPPAASYPQPQWAAAGAAPARVRLHLRDHLVTAAIVIVVLAVLGAIGYFWMGDRLSVQRVDNSQPAAPAKPGDQTQPGQPGSDLRQGAVFMQSNAASGNEVVAFARNADGTLREAGRYQTGGKGSGSLEDNADSLIVGSVDGEYSPHHITDKAELLFSPNAGSDTLSAFRIKPDGLELAGTVPSGGEKPVSLALTKGLLYVLNSGEFDDRLIGGDGNPLENCGHGQLPSITGFRVDQNGNLTQIPGSTRLLSGKAPSGCTQISFTPDGKTLIAMERIAGDAAGKGAITTFPVNADGTLGVPVMNKPAGKGPYSVAYLKDGTIIAIETNGGPAAPGATELHSYKLNGDGTLTHLSSVSTGHTDGCWIAFNADQSIAFTSGPFDDGVITASSVSKDGTLAKLQSDASGADEKNDHTPFGLLDLATSKDGKSLYQIDLNGNLYVFSVHDNGSLTFIEKHQPFIVKPLEEGGSGGPWGISVI
jgi:6-phosphogluconolactonase (cycloisomerase 2 family)